MSQDPYKYFRIESRELLQGISQGAIELERGGASADALARVLRLAHTLKGASRVVKQGAIAELAHAVEDVLAPHRESRGKVPPERISEVLRLVDVMTEMVSALDSPAPPGSSASRAATEERFETARVELAEMDALLETTFETSRHLGALRGEIDSLDRIRALVHVAAQERRRRQSSRLAALAAGLDDGGDIALDEAITDSLDALRRGLVSQIERAQGELAQVRSLANKIRLLPAGVIFPALDRGVRDAAQALGKQVELHVSGGEARLDAHVLDALREALLHVVRNSVAHGIEPEQERVTAGKPRVGRVEVSVARRGNRVVFKCRDDGRGIDLEAVRRAAVQRGRIPAAEAGSLAPGDVFRLLLKGGVTTARAVTSLSGRGIGLDVVRDTAARLKGCVELASEWGQGTTVEVTVPVSLSSLPSLVVESGGVAACLPLDAVRSTLMVSPADIARTSSADSILFEGQAVPFCLLSAVLQQPTAPAAARRSIAAVIVQPGTELAAVGVDRILGTSDVTSRPLHWVAAAPVVAGAALDQAGQPQLVLDPAVLVAAAKRSTAASTGSVRPRLPILVIDDSLTTRMLEQSILESAGFKVDMAVSAEEGLTKARAGEYGLFLVDVEMPGMDGFGFIAETRRDPGLRRVPSILVTSRNAPDDRRRGAEVGARAYIVKSEFDQAYMLKTIHELMA